MTLELEPKKKHSYGVDPESAYTSPNVARAYAVEKQRSRDMAARRHKREMVGLATAIMFGIGLAIGLPWVAALGGAALGCLFIWVCWEVV